MDEIKFCTELHVTNASSVSAALEERDDNIVSSAPPAGFAAALNAIDAPAMALVFKKLWAKNKVLKIAFLGDVDPTVKQKIKKHAEGWLDHMGVNFNFVEGSAGDIRITTTPGGSWSYVGTDCKTIPADKPTMNFGWLKPNTSDDEYSRVVLHEFGHALGAIHEHQHPTGGIPWDKPKVYAYYARQGWSQEQVDNNIFAKYDAGQLNMSNYDRESIMHYAVPNELTVGDFEIGWNHTLSPSDKSFIGSVYPRAARR